MKKMSRTELIRYIAETVLTYEKLEVTAHILWDYMCEASKMAKWMCGCRDDEPILIGILKHGVVVGNKAFLLELIQANGYPIHTIEISKMPDSDSDKDFTVKEY